MFTREQYHEAILKLNAGLTQLEPNGRNCAVCGDNSHQAWECHHNPLFMERLAWKAYNCSWKCYHCGEVFNDEDKARNHFGNDMSVSAACLQVKQPYF